MTAPQETAAQRAPSDVRSVESENPYILSICIPTYNRAATVHALVLKILENPAPGLEVVVQDNGSTDDTLKQLATIRDPRLAVYGNGCNRGVLFNVLSVLTKSRSAYCALLLDKDDISAAGIDEFARCLATTGVACGFCDYDAKVERGADVFQKGFEALSRVAYTCHHPTGYFFDTQLLLSLDVENRFNDMDFVGHFVFEFIFAELTMLGAAAIYRAPIFSPETLESAGRQKSFGTNASKEDAFFSPNGRLKMTINFSRHICTLPIAPSQKRTLIAECFMRGLMAATAGYRSVLSSPELSSHYHVPSRSVPRAELLRIGFGFYRQFAVKFLSSSGADAGLSHARFAFELFRRNGRKFFRRLVGSQ